MPKFLKWLVLATSLAMMAVPAHAQTKASDDSSILARLDKLEAENAKLKAQVAALEAKQPPAEQPAPVAAPVSPAVPPPVAQAAPVPASAPASPAPLATRDGRPIIGIDPVYSDQVLNHTENVNQRRIVQLKTRQQGGLNSLLTVSGELIVIGDAHWSNRANKFGYLMRHPTGNNQRTKATQEITVNSVQMGVTVAPAKGVTGYVEMLYDPEQSFGAGTLTALARNQIQVRKAYVLFGDLDRTPFYAAVGKMDVPFGLEDSVSPFTNSSNWHAFAPLAFGGELGFQRGGLSLRAMAIEGGAQFRSANTPVDGTAIPSKMNNYAFDASYTLGFGKNNSVMLGASYIRGSAYCQAYPITHFTACTSAVPAWAAYGRIRLGRLEVIGDFARTTKVWPGTQVPNPANPLAVYPASRVTSFTIGGRYVLGNSESNTKVSLEYSKFIAGPAGSPWQRQDQTVLGISHQFTPGVTLFGELIKVNGYSPLNFISGGNFPDGSTWSDASARSGVVMTGVRIGF